MEDRFSGRSLYLTCYLELPAMQAVVCIVHACKTKAIARFPVKMDFSDTDAHSAPAPNRRDN